MIQVLDRAFAILNTVSRKPRREHSLSELAGALGIRDTTCANIVRSLVDGGYLVSAGPRRGYRLGPKPFHLTRNAPYRQDLVDAAAPHIQELVSKVNETCLLSVLRANSRYVLFHVMRDSELQIRTEFIKDEDAYEVATGRLMIAYMPDAARDRFVASVGLPGARWYGVESRADLDKACAQIRKLGCCASEPKGDDRLVGIAFPVGREGDLAALGLYLPMERWKGQHKREILAAMRETAAGITRDLEANTQ